MFHHFKRFRLPAALLDEEVSEFPALSAADHRNCGQSSGGSGLEDFDCSESAQELHPLSVDKAQSDQVLFKQWYDFFIYINCLVSGIFAVSTFQLLPSIDIETN